MRTVLSMALGLTLVFALALTASAEEKAEKKTYEGTLTCAKCDLKIESKCATVLKVKDGDKDVIYYLDDASGKKNHKAICTEAKPAKVTGTVTEKDGKKILTATKVDIQ